MSSKKNKRRVTNNTATELSVRETSIYSGPIPPPEILFAYEKVSSGLANRIVGMSEKQSDHRVFMESTLVKAAINSQRWGQIFAFILYLFALGIGGGLIWYDKNIYGFITIVLAFAGTLGSIFIPNKNSKQPTEQTPPSQPR